jgi:hypothetical protein
MGTYMCEAKVDVKEPAPSATLGFGGPAKGNDTTPHNNTKTHKAAHKHANSSNAHPTVSAERSTSDAAAPAVT